MNGVCLKGYSLTYELPLNTITLITFFHLYPIIHAKSLSQFPILQNKILVRADNTFTISVCSWKLFFFKSSHFYLVVDIRKPSHVEAFFNFQDPCKDSKGLLLLIEQKVLELGPQEPMTKATKPKSMAVTKTSLGIAHE